LDRTGTVETRRVAAMIVAGGFIAGMSLCVLGVGPHASLSFASQKDRVDIQNRHNPLGQSKLAEDLGPMKCGIETFKLCQEDPKGTLSAGLDCTGAPRIVCGS
jgi:hypothetical protein